MKKYLIPALALSVALPLYVQAENQGQRPDFGQMFVKNFDANNDGRVSQDEFIQPQIQQMRQEYQRMDKNHDGSVDAGEADAYAQEMQRQMQEQMQQMKQRGGGQYQR